MRPVPLFRIFSLAAFAGVLAVLVLSSDASALQLSVMPQQVQPSTQRTFTSHNTPSDESGSNTNALNWAGYVATGGTYTSVSGSWIVPTVNASAENVADATWVGIGGVTNTDLIQAGTEAIPDSNGTLVYQAWYETLPQDSRTVPLSISSGDAVSVSITEQSSNIWEISFDDATTGKTYETTVQYDSSLSSSDWVEEMPVEVGGIIGLDDFGTVDFTSGYAIKNGAPVSIRSSDAQPLTMDNAEGLAVATPSLLTDNGSSFSVTRTDAASTPLAFAGNGISAVAVTSPDAYSDFGEGEGGYSIHTHRGKGGYRVTISF